MNTIKYIKSWEEIKTMEDNDLAYFWTPGAQAPYIANRPAWRDDVRVATAQDFVEAAGFDALSESDDGLTYTLEIAYPF